MILPGKVLINQHTKILFNIIFWTIQVSFEGYFPNVTEILNISERIGAMILLTHFNNFMGEEYSP